MLYQELVTETEWIRTLRGLAESLTQWMVVLQKDIYIGAQPKKEQRTLSGDDG